MRLPARPLALLTAAASAGAVVATVGWAQRWSVVTVTLLLALAWAAASAAVDAFTIWHRSAASSSASGPRGPITFVVRLGEERLDIARTSITLAAQAGPVVVVATKHHAVLDDLGGIEVREHVAPTIAEAIEGQCARSTPMPCSSSPRAHFR